MHARQPPGGGSEGDTTGGAQGEFHGEPRAPQRKQLPADTPQQTQLGTRQTQLRIRNKLFIP